MIFKYLQRDKSAKPDPAQPEADTAQAEEGAGEAAARSGLAAMPSGAPAPLSASALRRTVDPATLGFESTAELEAASGLIGQDRALEALAFGADMKALDFNVFVLGPPAAGKSTAVKAFLVDRAAGLPVPDDWVYVNNFETPNRPHAMRLPAGLARPFAKAMIAALDELSAALDQTDHAISVSPGLCLVCAWTYPRRTHWCCVCRLPFGSNATARFCAAPGKSTLRNSVPTSCRHCRPLSTQGYSRTFSGLGSYSIGMTP